MNPSAFAKGGSELLDFHPVNGARNMRREKCFKNVGLVLLCSEGRDVEERNESLLAGKRDLSGRACFVVERDGGGGEDSKAVRSGGRRWSRDLSAFSVEQFVKSGAQTFACCLVARRLRR